MLTISKVVRTPFLILCVFLAGCNILGTSNDEQDVPAKLNEAFALKEGERAYFDEEDLFLTFLDVREDSRCPLDAECIWEGQVSIEMTLKGQDLPAETILIEGFIGSDDQDSLQARFTSYQIQLNRLTPYPQSDQPLSEAKTGYFNLFRIETPN